MVHRTHTHRALRSTQREIKNLNGIKRVRTMNPFTHLGVTPPLLVGPEDVIDEFCLALHAGSGDPARALMVTGVRGIGKTVTLNACGDAALRRARRSPGTFRVPGLW
jgi:hypothetical protein